ncbi:hypothetical protein MGMO_2c00080 [Methyloglobulus morosus KoM1]|uniref:Uncharacterized protein n=1 Tax=Methyloglobulus morosus KoM1 TaxID=1116472 RepID=V5CBE7_9GAMM|nr:hypothetical protein [Methyloglobulus morosus]ESS74133.1 hypothetical protein MGMO_2c00080 [Methyloglobulus morosus KoM1]
MGTTTPKSKKTATEALAAEPTIAKAVSKKTTRKALTAIPKETAGTKKAVASETVTAKPSKKRKSAKDKVIRDSFSFPEQDYAKISELKKTCLAAGIHVKKGEILRAGLHLLTKLPLTELKQAVEQVEKVKTGRPKSSKN